MKIYLQKGILIMCAFLLSGNFVMAANLYVKIDEISIENQTINKMFETKMKDNTTECRGQIDVSASGRIFVSASNDNDNISVFNREGAVINKYSGWVKKYWAGKTGRISRDLQKVPDNYMEVFALCTSGKYVYALDKHTRYAYALDENGEAKKAIQFEDLGGGSHLAPSYVKIIQNDVLETTLLWMGRYMDKKINRATEDGERYSSLMLPEKEGADILSIGISDNWDVYWTCLSKQDAGVLKKDKAGQGGEIVKYELSDSKGNLLGASEIVGVKKTGEIILSSGSTLYVFKLDDKTAKAVAVMDLNTGIGFKENQKQSGNSAPVVILGKDDKIYSALFINKEK